MGIEDKMLLVILRWTSIPSRGGVAILLVASCYGNRAKLWPSKLPVDRMQLTFFEVLPALFYQSETCLLCI